jgi:prephenate dehydratase
MDIAYPGLPGTFAEQAAMALAPPGATLRSTPSVDAAFEALVEGRVEHAVVAFVSSVAGPVEATVERLASRPVRVVAEHELRVELVLVGARGATLDRVRAVRSHPMALRQCKAFFARHPGLEQVEATDTASAVAAAVREASPEVAAIGSRRAFDLYGGALLAADVQDPPGGRTRFLLLARR